MNNQGLIKYFKDTEEHDFTFIEVQDLILAFAKLEYEKNKENIDRLVFGKYIHKRVSDVAKFDRGYLKWLIRQKMLNKYEGLKLEVEKALKESEPV